MNFPQDQTKSLQVERGPTLLDARHQFSRERHGGRAVRAPPRRRRLLRAARSRTTSRPAPTVTMTMSSPTIGRPVTRRNDARGLGVLRSGLRLSKFVYVGGKTRIELLAEVFNVTNHDNWTSFNGNQAAGPFFGLPDRCRAATPVSDRRAVRLRCRRPPMTLQANTRLGPYEILTLLGAGGMGEVYRARDTRLNRDVAIKILPPAVADHPSRRARFAREARSISQLSHPNICTIHDVGEEDGIAFLVMEYIEGESLDKRLRLGPLPWALALEWAIQIADAIEAAHRRGMIHRDLKPGNIMVAESGVKLLDFGLAKLLEDRRRRATTGRPRASRPSRRSWARCTTCLRSSSKGAQWTRGRTCSPSG